MNACAKLINVFLQSLMVRIFLSANVQRLDSFRMSFNISTHHRLLMKAAVYLQYITFCVNTHRTSIRVYCTYGPVSFARLLQGEVEVVCTVILRRRGQLHPLQQRVLRFVFKDGFFASICFKAFCRF